MAVTKQVVHLAMVSIWGSYSILVGSLAILFGATSSLIWNSIIVAVTANSVHMVTFSLSKNGAEVTSTKSSTQNP